MVWCANIGIFDKHNAKQEKVYLFYSNQIDQKEVILDEEQSRHASKVMRLKTGDVFEVTSGHGDKVTCRIAEISKKTLTGTILEKTVLPRNPLKRAIAIAPTKNADRLEWFVEKAVEIGIDEIFFIKTQRSEKPRVNLERMNRIAITALKQCYQTFMPQFYELNDFAKVVEKLQDYPNRYIAHCEDPEQHLKTFGPFQEGVIVFIGPEGDFSPQEVEKAKLLGFSEVSLGPSRLRTETAGVYAVTVMNIFQ